MNDRRRSTRIARHWIRLAAGLVVVAIALYGYWQRQQLASRDAGPEAQQPPAVSPEQRDQAERTRPASRPTSPPAEPHVREQPATVEEPPVVAAPQIETVIAAQMIYDRDDEVAYRGDVDVGETIARIRAGKRLNFPNDGSTFQNRERRLPRKPAGYYREFVHPTPGLAGPGPQRIVTGDGGEVYYTPDHYRSFRRLDKHE